MGRRYYSNGKSSHFDKNKAQIFDDIYNEKDPYENKKLSNEQGLYLLKNLDIGRQKYTTLRQFLDPFIHLPTFADVTEKKNAIKPAFEPVLAGLWWPLPKLVSQQVKELLENMVKDENNEALLDEIMQDGITMKGGGGFDASGRHAIFKSFTKEEKHLIFGGFRVHSLKNKRTGRVIYTESSMGTDSEVPWFLIPGKEETAIVKKIVEKLERETLECIEQPLETTVNGKIVKVSSNIKHSQFDRSLIEKISGLGGALCTLVIVVI